MIRFLDLRGQGAQIGFTFLDTSTDTIVNYGSNNCWDKWEDFENDFISTVGTGDYVLSSNYQNKLLRFKGLCPAWVFVEKVKDDKPLNHEFDTPAVSLGSILEIANAYAHEHNVDYDEIEITSTWKENNIIVRLIK